MARSYCDTCKSLFPLDQLVGNSEVGHHCPNCRFAIESVEHYMETRVQGDPCINVQVVPDCHIADTWAVQVVYTPAPLMDVGPHEQDADGFTLQFLVKRNEPALHDDNVEEVEFTTWPPHVEGM